MYCIAAHWCPICPTFCNRYFQIHFWKQMIVCWSKFQQYFVSMGPIDSRTGDDPYPEIMMTQIMDTYMRRLAPVPLSIFRSNSKFDENSECSSFEYTRPITRIFCTRHDSDTVVTCAKYRCDRPRILYTRVFWIFIEFRIRSKYA